VPLHFSAFHPDFRLLDHPPTPLATLQRARTIALGNGLHHVYVGNLHDDAGATTFCAGCGTRLIGRQGYAITTWALTGEGACPSCATACVGRFESTPGTWGNRRMPIEIVPLE
jgi:pyruvate formate lyase activating enzyme